MADSKSKAAPKVKAMPAALRRQMYNASGRFDDTSSVSSWAPVDAEPTLEDPWPEPAMKPVQEEGDQPGQTDRQEASSSAAPAAPTTTT